MAPVKITIPANILVGIAFPFLMVYKIHHSPIPLQKEPGKQGAGLIRV